MVSVRRPGARSISRGGIPKWMMYGRYALAGGVAVFLVNFFRGGGSSPAHSILQLDTSSTSSNSRPPRAPLSRDPDLQRRTPPDFARERLERRQHEEEEEEEDLGHGRQKLEAPNRNRGQLDSGDGDTEKERISGDNQEDNEDNEENDNTNKQHKITYVSPNGDVLEKPEGTGPTKLGFVMDLVHERGHPKFRTASTMDKIESSRQNHAQLVATALAEHNVQPCEYFDEGRLLHRKTCRHPERSLLVYNGATFPRTWCGVSIPPKSAARMNDPCHEPVQLFERDFPPVDGQGMSPIVLHAQADANAHKELQPVPDCTIPCQVEKDMTGIIRYIQGTDWTIYHSDQDPNSRREIQVELSKFRHDEYFSTAYFKSDVPLSRVNLDTHTLRKASPPVDFDSVQDKGIYIVNDQCAATNSRRLRWKEVLETQYHVDSLGKCGHSKDVDTSQSIDTLQNRLTVMKQYKFNLGFEISTHKDWITELSYEAMLSGAVPILLGASNLKSHFPRNSAIFANDFNSWDKLAAHVNTVANDKALWNSYHAWRKDPHLLAAFERKYEFTKTSPECRLCSWAYAKMFGLGWNHQLQKVQEPHIDRKLCIDEDSGMIVKPFREVLSVGKTSLQSALKGDCKVVTMANEKHAEQDGWTIVKSVVQHDSVTDISIHSIDMGSHEGEVTLTLVYDNVNNTEAAFFANGHTLVEIDRGMLMSSATIQDHKTKVTVLANWETTIWSPSQGVIRVVLQSKDSSGIHEDEQRRIRVISEDMGQLHDKMAEYFPSSFSKRVIQDFIDPLEVFYPDP